MATHKPKRIGAICVEKGLITRTQLEAAPARQEVTGQVLGEILVGQDSMTRMQLADALGEQWSEMSASTGEASLGEDVRHELRLLLDEAQAARAHLTRLDDELRGRLEALEALVGGVNERLSELTPAQSTAADGDGPDDREVKPASRRTRRASVTAKKPKAASAGSRAKPAAKASQSRSKTA